MLPRITDARHIANHTIWLRFADGIEGEVDLSRELEGEVFEPLKDVGSNLEHWCGRTARTSHLSSCVRPFASLPDLIQWLHTAASSRHAGPLPPGAFAQARDPLRGRVAAQMGASARTSGRRERRPCPASML